MRVDSDSQLSSISASKEFKLSIVYFGTSEQIKPLQPVGRAAEFKFESKFDCLSPCRSSGNLSEDFSRR